MNVKMNLEDLSLEELSFLSVYYATDQFKVNFLTSNKTRAERLDVCYGCEEHKVITEDDTDEENLIGKSACEECGCILDNKVTEIFQICPLDKWGPSKDDWIKTVYPMMKEFIKKNGTTPTEW